MRTLGPVVAIAAVLTALAAADAEFSRRDREDPELVIDDGGRTGACDQLRFTPDGKQLLAVGDDKVVRVWSFADGKLDPKSRVLRWGVWREQRGAIYAMDISPDGKLVAIGGLGAATPTVAVLDLADGHIIDLTTAPNDETGNVGAFWAAAFAPSGKRVAFGGGDGSVWIWDLESHKLRRLGKHRANPFAKHGEQFNTVRLIYFKDEGSPRSLAEDGQLLEWNANDANALPSEVIQLKIGASVFRAEVSPDRRWLAAALKNTQVQVQPLAGGPALPIELPKGQAAHSLAFDPTHNRLAVGVAVVPASQGFPIETDDRIAFYDLDKNPPAETPGPTHSYRADRLVFHPKLGFLAVAGGDNHEVTLWDLANIAQPASVVRGTGKCLWDVAISQDGGAVGFRDQRDAASGDPNARGKGPWRSFDLARRQWLAPDDFKPVARVASAGGWTIEPDVKDPAVWWAVNQKLGPPHALPLDPNREGQPRCWTFLPGQAGDPVRVAVGHYWGFSVIELTAKEAKRTRLCVGHQGEVMALAPSADGTWIVSCSDDMTLAAWSLTQEWPSQRLLGASFNPNGASLIVKAVDPGSPAWEAGLLAKDEVTHFAFSGKWMKDDPAAWLARLTDPVPGREHAFDVVRDGQNITKGGKDGKEPLMTTLKQRPLWRFFPAGGDEWVLWMWRNSFYDTSTKGDYTIGWHVNAPTADPNAAPKFYRAEQFRRYYHRPDVINKLLKSRDPAAALAVAMGDNRVPLHFDGMEPPAAQLTLGAVALGKDVEATLSAYARGGNPDEVPVLAELWINDYRLTLPESDVRKWQKDTKGRGVLTAAIPFAKLRAGRNVITFQTWNLLGGRSDAAQAIDCNKPLADPRLVGLFVGINDYKAAAKAPNGARAFGDLHNAVNDADKLSAEWKSEKMFAKTDIIEVVDPDVSRQRILDALDRLAKTANADDTCILFFSGHGDYPSAKTGFVFCTPNYDRAKAGDTGIASDVLFRKLAAIPCRKLLMLDACHSGAAADYEAHDFNQARDFAPDGQGPFVIAACDLNQLSLEHEKYHHGLFTEAILDTLADKAHYPAHDGRKQLTAEDLFESAVKKMPGLLGLIGHPENAQVPVHFAPQDVDYVVAQDD